MGSSYVELRCRSAFSFLDGASAPEELIARASSLGYCALALGDTGGVYGAPRFFRAAKATGVRTIVGAELNVAGSLPLLLLVQTRQGYRNLCRLITQMKRGFHKNDLTAAVNYDDLQAHNSGLIALAGAKPREDLDRLQGVFGAHSLFVEMQRHFDDQAALTNNEAVQRAYAQKVPVLVTNDVRYTDPARRKVQDILTCAHERTSVDLIGRKLLRNTERHLKAPDEMARLFRDQNRALANTLSVAERCEFSLSDLGYQFPVFEVPAGETEQSYLEKLTWLGARDRYEPLYEKAQRQIQHELNIVGKLGLAGYFLVVWDIVRFARSQGILAQGRGSAANSAVCYALKITAVDPVGMDLLFERFLSEERVSSAPSASDRIPDIDLDLPSGERRESVIQYVYQKYGGNTASGAAMTANVITFRPRMAVRTVGRALGFSEEQLSRISKHLPHYVIDGDKPLSAIIAEAGFPATEERTRHLAEVSTALLNLPRHLGQHSGGMVLAAGRLDEVVPLEPASMPGRTVVQWDKDDCADLGIVKVDLLGLGMLAVLEEAVPLIAEHEGIHIDYAKLPADDRKVYKMLCQADTVGVFQVESRAQMATLPRMKPDKFYDLVVEVAIIRPGPIVGRMVSPYLLRRAGKEPITYAHPSLEPILKRTLGVPLFQEQLIRMAMAAAGFTGGQAEELRRAMGFKRSVERMGQIEQELRAGMTAQGIKGVSQDEIVGGIKSFALYGFPESHAASFALIAYASAYLKAHHGAAFLCALLNNWPMGFYHPATLITDAARHNIATLPIDVMVSDWLCTLQRDSQGALAVRLGLKYVVGLRQEIGHKIVSERNKKTFCLMGDFHVRVAPRQDEMTALATVGAFVGLGGTRRAALWQAEALGKSGALFARSQSSEESPLPEMTDDEETLAELHGSGVTLGPHPISFARPWLQKQGVVPASALLTARNGQRISTAGMVIVRQRPMTAKGLVFITLEDETGFSNAVVMPDVFAQWRIMIISHAALIIEGEVQNRDGVVTVKADNFLPVKQTGTEVSRSHDFH